MLLVNAILNMFLKKIVILNIISFIKIREVMTKESYITNYSNHHLIINNIINISKLV